jgi:hypothetical protein
MIAQGRARAHVGLGDRAQRGIRVRGLIGDFRDILQGDIKGVARGEMSDFLFGFGAASLKGVAEKYQANMWFKVQEAINKQRVLPGSAGEKVIKDTMKRLGILSNIGAGISASYAGYAGGFTGEKYYKQMQPELLGEWGRIGRLNPDPSEYRELTRRQARRFGRGQFSQAWQKGVTSAAPYISSGLMGLQQSILPAIITSGVIHTIGSRMQKQDERTIKDAKLRMKSSMELTNMYAASRNPFIMKMIEQASGIPSATDQAKAVANIKRAQKGHIFKPSEEAIQQRMRNNLLSYSAYGFTGFGDLLPKFTTKDEWLSNMNPLSLEKWRKPAGAIYKIYEKIVDFKDGTTELDRRNRAMQELIEADEKTRKETTKNRKDKMEQFLSDPVEANNEKLRNLKFEAIKNERNRRSMMAPTV